MKNILGLIFLMLFCWACSIGWCWLVGRFAHHEMSEAAVDCGALWCAVGIIYARERCG